MVLQGLEWTFIFLSYVLVSARVYVRVWMRRDRLYWSDYWLMAALASAQGLVICDTLTYQMNAMDDFTITSVSLDKVCRELDPNMLRTFAWLPRHIAISQVWANHSKKAGTYYDLEHFKTRSNEVHIVNYRLDSLLGTYSTLAYTWRSSALSLSTTTSYH